MSGRKSVEFDEADVLRAAAVIRDELDDYEDHLWKDVIAAVGYVLDLRAATAGDLAWRAMNEHFQEAPTVWTGPRGARVVRRRPSLETVLTVACPRCDAPAGERCVKVN